MWLKATAGQAPQTDRCRIPYRTPNRSGRQEPMVSRIYVEKKPGFDVEAQQLKGELTEILGIKGIEALRIINRYDVEGIDEELFRSCVPTVFSEPQVDVTYDELPASDGAVFAVEFLPGQFDQRADSASECVQLISQGERPAVRSAKVYMISGALDEAAIDALAEQIEIRFTNGTGEDTRLTIDGQDASAAIRTPQVDANVSKVSAYPGVRAAMLIHQRRAAEDRDIVAEGRDIGTVVFPNAQVKVFLTADPRERARRRVLQRHQNDAQPLTSEQLEAEVDETLDALKQRDKLDSSREVAPLVPAEDAVHVDSTAHTIDEVVSIIEGLINQRR